MNWEKLILYCKRNRVCTQGHIALWTEKMGISAYLIFKQLREMCKEGLLDDEEVYCVASKNRIMFKKHPEVEGSD